MKEKHYMHVYTGSVDTFDGWVDERVEGCSSADIQAAIDEGVLVEVIKDEKGNWIDA